MLKIPIDLPSILLIDIRPQELEKSLSKTLVTHLQKNGFHVSERSSLDLEDESHAIVCVVDDGSDPILRQQSEMVERASRLISQQDHILWITLIDSFKDPEGSDSGLVRGFARVSRSENPASTFVTLDIERTMEWATSNHLLKTISSIIVDSFLGATSEHQVLDLDFIYKDGAAYISRLLPLATINDLEPSVRQTCSIPFLDPSRPLRLDVKQPGSLSSMSYVANTDYSKYLLPHEVVIEVRACGVNFRDVVMALTQSENSTSMVGECAGIISAVGSDAEFQIGDRVCACFGTSYASYARVSRYYTTKIPDSMPFSVAASIPISFSTAYYALVDVARLRRGQSVLIHSATGGLGQAVIILAQHIGAVIYATAGNASKRRILAKQHSIPETHIFSSKSRLFKSGVLRLTGQTGVDVAINSLKGDGLSDTLDCIAKMGTFIEVGKTDIYLASRMSLAPFDRNITFASVDLRVIAEQRPDMLRELLEKCIALFSDGRIRPIQPINTMPITNIEAAFRLFQTREHCGKIVLEADHDTRVNAASISLPKERGTYLIAGGLGDFGRCLCQFLAKEGVTHILLLTRHAYSDEERRVLEMRLGHGTAHVVIKQCDITDALQVERTILWVQENMPPIKVAIQAAIVLRVRRNCDSQKTTLIKCSRIDP